MPDEQPEPVGRAVADLNRRSACATRRGFHPDDSQPMSGQPSAAAPIGRDSAPALRPAQPRTWPRRQGPERARAPGAARARRSRT